MFCNKGKGCYSMPALDKAWALNQLRHKRNSYVAALAAMHLLNTDSVLALSRQKVLLKHDSIIFNPNASERTGRRYEVKLRQIVSDYLYKRQDHGVTIREFHKFVRRNLIKESYEVAWSYTRDTKFRPILKTQPWFHFTRLVRDAITHDLHFRLKKELKILPVSWNGKTIDIAMDDQEMSENFLDPLITIDLIVAITTFVGSN